DRDSLFHAKTLEQVRDPLLGEDAHQVVFEGKIEPRGTGIALASGTSAKLIVDTARFMALGAEDVQAPGGYDLVMLFVGLLFVTIKDLNPLICGDDVFVAGVVPDTALGIVDCGL